MPLGLWRCRDWERSAAAKGASMNRRQRNRLLHEAMEQQAAGPRGASVKSESKLIEIKIQMVGRDGTLMSAQQPTFEQGGDLVGVRQ